MFSDFYIGQTDNCLYEIVC